MSGTLGTVTGDYSDDLAYVTLHSLDTDHDGTSETVEIQFNEPVRDSFADATTWQVERKDTVGNRDYFDNFSTSVSSITFPATDSDPNDEYITVSITAPAFSGTPQLRIRRGADGITDLAGNPYGGTDPSWVDVDDKAQAVLLSASIDDKGTAGLFNSLNNTNDTRYLVFSADIDAPSGWSADSAEAFFEFGLPTTDGNNFQDIDGGDSITLLYTRNPSNDTLRIRQDAESGSGPASFNLILTGSTVAVVANEYPVGTPTIFFRGESDGLGVYLSAAQTASFSVVGGAGTRGAGGVSIGGVSAEPAAGRTAENLLILPQNWPSSDQSNESIPDTRTATAPYSAPAVERRNLNSSAVATARSAAAPTSSVAPTPPAPSAAALKVVSLLPKEIAPPMDVDSVTVPTVTATVPDADTTQDPVVVAQTPRTLDDPVIVANARGATVAGDDAGGRGSAAAILALVAIMVILAGAALMVLSRLGRGHTVAPNEDGESRAE